MSSRVPPILQGSPKGWFDTMHLPDEVFIYYFILLLNIMFKPYLTISIFQQPFGEIDPFFIGQHFHHVGSLSNIYDTDGIPHQIYYNQSMLNPLITFRCPRLRNYYTWIGIKRLTFIYFGHDSFQLVLSEGDGEHTPSTFPPFHSLSVNNDDYITFRIVINILNIISSKLVSSYGILTLLILITQFLFNSIML
jgi:hypothetical protein